MVPLVEEWSTNLDPWDVAQKFAHCRHLLFLDSADRSPDRGRYSYVTADPILTGNQPPSDLGPPIRFQDHWAELPPFRGGLAGLYCYELGCLYEPRVSEAQHKDFTFPHVVTGLYDWVISFDHARNRAWLISTGRSNDGQFHENFAAQRLQWIRSTLQQERPRPRPISGYRLHTHPLAPQYDLPDFPGVTSNFTPEGFRSAIRRAVEYIHAGDCFQINLSQRLLAPLREHPLALYARLRERNPAPLSCYFDAGDFQVVSASPERFLRVASGGVVVAQPIKGTRPRGRDSDEDAALVRELTGSEKDRAENVMIVDLLRNDLGRVCEYGSISVPRVCDLETYRYVHHLVSEVRGRLRPGATPLDLLRAAFPGGSVTGAPKVRAMQIIAELEPTLRGPYCGGIGFISFDGSMDMNILIRTFTASHGWLQFPVGGGIVADSDPAREYEETLHKAVGLLRALHS